MGTTAKSYTYSALIMTFFVLTLFCLEGVGEKGRVFGIAGPITTPPSKVRVVDNPKDALTQWRTLHCRGRVIISFSRRLHFYLDEPTIPGGMSFPIRVFNLAQQALQEANANNFLYVAVKTGIARQVVHVINESQVAEKVEQVKRVEGASVTKGGISAPIFGSPRHITSLMALPKRNEPVLIHVDASFFKEYEPQTLFDAIKKTGLTTDAVVMSLSSADGEVTSLERARLEAFARLLGVTNDKH